MGDFISRRDLLKASAISAVGYSVVRPLAAIAGPFTIQDYRNLVPRDKKLDPAWVRSLTERGEEPWVSGDDLKFIGMPIGGLFAGTVYLGGDGTLWNWDIFNQHHQGGVDRPGGVQYGDENLSVGRGANYVDPPEQRSPFRFRAAFLTGDQISTLGGDAWNTEFLGQYPVGTVKYTHVNVPAEVVLEAFSPFCPLDVEKSSYPATILRYTVKNPSSVRQRYFLQIEFDNPCGIHSKEQNASLELTARETVGSLVGCEFGVEQIKTESKRPDVLFEDFESGIYGDWTIEGSAFGDSPLSS